MHPLRNLLLLLTVVAGTPSCATPPDSPPVDPLASAGNAEAPPPGERRLSQLEIQALVMGMADEYGAALGEALYLLVRSDDVTPKGRWLVQSFLRNGMGAAIDIAAGSNPSVALLDLMVLVSLLS